MAFACLACDFKLITTWQASDSGDQCLSWWVYECALQVIERGGSLLVRCHRRTAQSHVSAPACQLSIICSDRSGYNPKWHQDGFLTHEKKHHVLPKNLNISSRNKTCPGLHLMYRTLIYKIISGMKDEIMTTFTLWQSIKDDKSFFFFFFFSLDWKTSRDFKEFFKTLQTWETGQDTGIGMHWY